MNEFGKYQKLFPLAHDAVQWREGFWGNLHALCRDTISAQYAGDALE